MGTLPRFSGPTSGPSQRQLALTRNDERAMYAGVFYLAGGALIAIAALDPVAHTGALRVVSGLAVAVGATSLAAHRAFTYAMTVATSLLAPALICAALLAGAGSWSSALVAVLYTFVAVHVALVLHWKHVVAVLAWSAATAHVAARQLDAPLPPWAVAVVFLLCCGTLATVTLRLVTEVRHRASTDPLTGVANRGAFETALRHAAATVARTGEPLALVAIDLDEFRGINNTAGHAAGDELLIDATRAWQSQLRARDQLARIGGDEFCVVLPGADVGQARAIAARLEQAMPAGTACSTGVAVWDEGQPLAELSAAADRDLYANKIRKKSACGPTDLG